jgi:hypothetical protein
MIFTKILHGWKTEFDADFESIQKADKKFVGYQHKGVEIVIAFSPLDIVC